MTLDLDEIRDYLLSFDTFAGAPQEALNYVHGALQRFLITLEMVPPGDQGQQLLELGAGPYFITLMLKKYRHYDLTLSNYYGDAFPVEDVQVVKSETRNEEYAFRYRNFNGERDAFPYSDATFDMVLCCEIIEHLTMDPTHMLCEIHRVLKPGGKLLITTPNVHNLSYGTRLLRGSGNIFHPYSGYGIYGRHQREYMMGELLDLLQGVGYAIVESRFADIYPHERWQNWLRRWRPQWRDNLFVLAQKADERRYYYPPNLYISTHALRRVVSSDVRMGWNEVGHLGPGWWGPEQLAGFGFRWTSGPAKVNLVRPAQANRIVAEVCAGPSQLGAVTVTFQEAQGGFVTQTIEPERWQTIELPLSASTECEVELTITAALTRNPAALRFSQDSRDLGVMVRRIQVSGR
jgi:SAM-dependent methyltransferase